MYTLKNDSVLPTKQISSEFKSRCIHKADGHNGISIRTIKICDKSLLQPIILLFRNSVKSPCYPDIWKRFNIISDKQLLRNYRSISPLPIFGKIFERLIVNSLILKLIFNITFFWMRDPNQSGFRPTDVLISLVFDNQFLAITHEIFEAFDFNLSLEVK